MTNEEALQLLSARNDGELTPEQEQSLDIWLRENPDGKIVAEAFRSQDAEARLAFEPRRQAASLTAERVAAQLPEPSMPHPSHGGSRPRRSLWSIVPLFAATAALLAIVLFWMRSDSRHPTPSKEVVQKKAESLTGLMRAKAKPNAPPAVVAKLGEKIITKPGEKRRVTLPDGSILYLNQNTSVELAENRQVKLERGQIFVEAVPADAAAGRGSFQVRVGPHQVVALGTKFAVDAADKRLSVPVSQGSVKFDDTAEPVLAGQVLQSEPDKAPSLVPARRASHDLDWTRELMIAADSPLVPAGKYEGGALVAVDPYGQEAKLSLVNYHIDVHIEDGFARTTIDQTYFNHENMQMEGTFYFPLPPDASLSRLAMYVANGDTATLMEGGMAERDHARQTYEKIRHARRDPALLEWVDGSLFKMRVFPLEARQEKRLVLSYSQKLPVLYGRSSYRFPAGHTLNSVKKWSFNAVVKGGEAISASSPSHPTMQFARNSGDLYLSDKADHVKADRDVVLELTDRRLPVGEAIRWASAEHDGAKYLMLRYKPELQGSPRRERRDWVFLFEASGARDPLVARAQVEVIRALLNNVEHDDTFAILTVGTRIHKFGEQAQRVTPEAVTQAIGFLEKTHLIGALNLEQALIEAEPYLHTGNNPHLVHVGGGVATLGEQRSSKLMDRLPSGTRYVGVAVGKRFSPAFMKVAAEKTGGFFTQINPDEPIAWRGFDLAATLNTPRLLDITLSAPTKAGESAVRLLPFTNALSQGEELAAVARIDGPQPASITIRGSLDGTSFERTIDVKEIAANAGYLPRTWAKLEIDRLLAEDRGQHRNQIVEMSKAMYVMTPYTSLLVLENEAMYKEFSVDRGRKDHWAMYPCPEKVPVVYIPDPNQPRDRNAPEFVNRKPHDNVVMQTIMLRNPPRYITWPGRNADDSPIQTAGQKYGERIAQAAAEETLEEEALSRAPLFGDFPYTELQKATLKQIGRVMYRKKAWEGAGQDEWNFRTGRDNFDLSPAGGSTPQIMASGLYLRRSGRHNINGTGTQQDFFSAGLMDGSVRFLNESEDLRLVDGERHRFWMNNQPSTLNYDRLHGSIEPNLSNPDPGLDADRPSPFTGERLEEGRNVENLFIDSGTVDLPPVALSFAFPSTSLGRGEKSSEHFFSRGDFRKLSPGPDLPQLLHGGEWYERDGKRLDIERVLERDEKLADYRELGETSPFGRIDSILLDRPQGPRYYGRPSFSGQERVFTDLAAYAPGMSSSVADIRAVLEAEAEPRSGHRKGSVDPAARQRIESARSAEWHNLVFKDETGKDFTFSHDGRGRYAYERRLTFGLIERVVCDGSTLLHLYPELGIGARRPVSRFHRAELGDLLPDLLPPADDLAYGADIKLIDANTVAISSLPPVDADERGPRQAWIERHLVFAGNRLAERQWVLMPEKKVLSREVYETTGTIKLVDAKGKETVAEKRDSKPSAAPDLKPDVSSLVVLPLPLRSREIVYRKHGLEPNRNLHDDENACFEYLAPEAALELLACEFAMGESGRIHQIWESCFAERGDRRIGVYALMMSSYDRPQRHADFQDSVSKALEANALTPLMRYLTLAFDDNSLFWQRQLGILPGPKPADDFLGNLLVFRALEQRWTHTPVINRYWGSRASERDRALAFARQHADNAWGWCVLGRISDQAVGFAFRRAIAETWGVLAEKSGLNYMARYEQALKLLYADRQNEARAQFRKLFEETFAKGILPPIDSNFRSAFVDGGDPALWPKLMEKAARACLAAKQRPVVVLLAWQCRQLGDYPLADDLLALALKDPANEVERVATTLAAIEYLWAINSTEQADRLVVELLQIPALQRQPMIWRLASKIAAKRGQTLRQFDYLEKALDREFPRMPDVFSVEPIRRDYGALLNHYEWLAEASRSLKVAPPADLLARTVKAADRRRSLDPESTKDCNDTAKILRMLGGPEADALAWDFLTTPLALKPNESDPWLGLAASAMQEGDLNLADQCYEAAFAAEPTNAQILWDRSKLLERRGETARSQELLKQLLKGDWQPRFEGLRTQARWTLEGK